MESFKIYIIEWLVFEEQRNTVWVKWEPWRPSRCVPTHRSNLPVVSTPNTVWSWYSGV